MIITSDNRLDPTLDEVGQATLRRFRRTVTLASAATVVAAVAGLLGYVPGLRILGSIRADYRLMAPSTAICLLVLSAALYFHARRPWQGASRLTIATLVLLVTVFSLLEFIQLFVGTDIGLEDLLVPELGTLGGLPLGRMSPVAGAALTLAGLGTFLLLASDTVRRHARGLRNVEASLGVFTMLVGSLVLLSYVYGTPLIYGRSGAPMAATAAIAVICLGVTLIASAGPLSFPTCLIVGDSAAPRLARAFIPIVAGALLLHGALFHAADFFSGISDAVVTSTVAVIVGVTAVIAAALVARSTGTLLDESVQRLRASEAQYRAITQSANDAIVTTDGAAIIVGWNPGAERIFGYPESQAIGQPVTMLMPEDFRALHAAAMRQISSNEEPRALGTTISLTGLRKDGLEFPMEMSLSAWTTPADRFFTGIIRDVTTQHVANEALLESENNLREAQEIARVGSYVLDVPNDVWRSSQVLDAVLGIAADFPRTTEGWVQIIHPVDRDQMRAYLGEVFATQEQFKRTYRIARISDGAERWVQGLGKVEYDAAGAPLRMVGTIQDITERQLAEDALRSSEEWHRTILQTAMVGLLMVDAEGHLVEVNDTYCRMSGYSERELLTMRVSDLEVHDTEARIAQLSQLAMTRGEISLEGRHRRKDGTLFDVDVRIQYRPLHGAVFVTLLQDITARKQAEAALVKSEELFRTIFAEAPLGVAVIDSFTGHIHEVNARFAAIAGRTVEEMTTLDWMSITHPDDVQQDLDYMAQMNAGQIPGFTMVKRYRRPDGSHAWIRMTIARMTISRAGHPQHLCMIDDITERKRTTDELQVRSRVLEQSPASIVITDRDGNIEYVNPRFEQVTGYTKAEVVGKNPRILKSGTTPPETYIDMWATIAEGGEWHGELCNRRKNGELYWEYAAISGLADDSGKGGHFVAVKEDITARKHAERQQAALQDQLAQMQKMESIGLLAGGVAHDFNNMLAAILGYAELVMLKLGSEHAVHPDVLAIRTAAQRSADLTGRLLAFARKQTMAPKVLVLNDTIESMLTILGRLLGEHVKLEWLPGTALWSVEADRTQIDQVLTNLAINARDAMTGHKAVLEISTANVVLDAAFVSVHPGARAGEFVHLGFRDGGCGMDAITRAHLFEPFFTTKEPGQGTGLGLSVVHGIVTQHRGFIYVESAPGLGSTFHLCFPRCGQQGAEIANPAQPLRRGTGTILLAEDEDGVRAACAKMLRALGYTVLVSRNGEAAMEVAASHREPIHLLLTDVIMPGMNGAQLRDRLLQQRPNVKVLFMSGYAGSVISTEGVLTTGTHFIQKPFTMHELAEAVHEALDA